MIEACVPNGRNASIQIPKRTRKVIQSEFDMPDSYIEIAHDEIEHITGGAFGDHWDFSGRFSGAEGIVAMCAYAGLTTAVIPMLAYEGLAVGLGLTPIGITFAAVFCVASVISGNIASSMVHSAKVALDNYYLKDKSWSLWEHWGWFGLVLDGFEVRA